MMRIRTGVAFLLCICMLLIPHNLYAESSQSKSVNISINDAYNQAISNNNQIKLIDKNIYTLTKPYGASQKAQSISQYDMVTQFENLYARLKNGEFLQSYEQGELVMYYAVLKDSDFFNGKSLSPVINPTEFPNCDIWVQMMQMKISKESLRAGICDGIRQLYDNLIYINDTINTSEEYVKILEADAKDATKLYKSGSISELERLKKENNYEINKLELNKLKRTKENLERTLKKTLGMSLDTELEIIPYQISEKDLQVPDLKMSLNNALLNRHEIANLKMNMLATQIEIPTLDDYMMFMPDNENIQMLRQEALLSIDELKNNIKLQEENITQEINNAYIKVANMKKSLDIEKKRFDNTQKNYEAAKLQFNAGNISKRKLDSIKADYESGETNYQKAVRSLAYEIAKFQKACGIG